MRYDYCVVGGGIVGLATAMAILDRQPGTSLRLVDKEVSLGTHQTGHNSGVIHSGIYYAPGSLKARLCREGAQATKDFAARHEIPVDVCGKLLVATDAAELARMDALYARSRANDVEVERLGARELHRREPNVRGVGALFVPATGIVDYSAIAEVMGEVVRQRGGKLTLGAMVTDLTESGDQVTVTLRRSSADAAAESASEAVRASRVVVCAGLQADRLARMAGVDVDFRIVPFRGEYYRLPERRSNLVRHLIYPIPDPELPFLGVHLTRTTDGGVTVGPNAVLGLSREGYRKFSFDRRDVADYVRFPGMWRVARANLRTGVREMTNSLSKRGYLRECRKYAPSLSLRDLQPEPAGIRAQAVLRDGTLVHDFLFAETARTLHVCNAPSPAATSAIPIGEMITDRLLAADHHVGGRA
jgi:(S)-2-hydroxyglutarate dehydrogenase